MHRGGVELDAIRRDAAVEHGLRILVARQCDAEFELVGHCLYTQPSLSRPALLQPSGRPRASRRALRALLSMRPRETGVRGRQALRWSARTGVLQDARHFD